jgi:hypothetical protein
VDGLEASVNGGPSNRASDAESSIVIPCCWDLLAEDMYYYHIAVDAIVVLIIAVSAAALAAV